MSTDTPAPHPSQQAGPVVAQRLQCLAAASAVLCYSEGRKWRARRTQHHHNLARTG